ncbi:MAG: CBS domain-containing protein [Pseudomonadota bacterium]
MPESYRPVLVVDREKKRTVTQTVKTNVNNNTPTVQLVLDHNGRRIVTIRPEETLGRAVEVLRDNNIGALVVTDGAGALKGILSERDIVRKLADAPGKTLPHRVEQIMTENVQTCTAEESLIDVLRRMSKGHFRHMPVVDGKGVVGMVTIGDVINHRLRQLEHETLQLKQLVVG